MTSKLARTSLAAAAATAALLAISQGVAHAATIGGTVRSPDGGAAVVWNSFNAGDGSGGSTTFKLQDIACDGLVPRLQYRKESGSITTLEHHNGCEGTIPIVRRYLNEWSVGTQFSFRVCNVGSGQASNPCSAWVTKTVPA